VGEIAEGGSLVWGKRRDWDPFGKIFGRECGERGRSIKLGRKKTPKVLWGQGLARMRKKGGYGGKGGGFPKRGRGRIRTCLRRGGGLNPWGGNHHGMPKGGKNAGIKEGWKKKDQWETTWF